MKDRVLKVLKRGASGLLAVLIALCLVGTPRAKAVVSEGALLGSLFGSLLVSMGFSWAADNMDAPTFGDAIYDLIKQCDEEKDTGIQLLLDSGLAGLTAVGNGKLTFSQQWVKLANSFAAWFQEKFFTGEDLTAEVSPSTTGVYLQDGSFIKFGIKGSYIGDFLKTDETYVLTNGLKFGLYYTNSQCYLIFKGQDDSVILSNRIGDYGQYYFLSYNPDSNGMFDISWNCSDDGKTLKPIYWTKSNVLDLYSSALVSAGGIPLVVNGSLVAEKPQEVHYPAVAEDGSQVYEITVDGVTATDIEGIIQGAVDRILAGTASIVGSVEQAGTGEEVANPEIDPYKVSLSSVFPFCIPFDVYNMVTMFVAEPEAPNAEWTFTLPWSNKEYSVGWDLSDFDGVAQVCRNMQLVLFAVGLAVITHKVIKW